MSKKSFYISQLKITGDGKEPVVINFTKGLNVVLGPSDCGKSHLYKIIYFVLGGSKAPDEDELVPETVGYKSYFLEVKDNKNNVFTLKRSRNSKSSLYIYNCPISDISDKTKIDDEKTKSKLSEYLLKQFGFSNKIVLHTLNKPSNLGFSDVKNIFMVDEDNVSIESKFTFLTGDYTNPTRGRSVFKCLISNDDYSSFKQATKIKEEVLSESAKKEYILSLITNLKKEITESKKPSKPVHMEDDITNLYKTQAAIRNDIQKFKQNTDEIETKKTILNNKLIQDKGLLKRLELLKNYYDKDNKRLDFINEGNTKLASFHEVSCPLCGTLSSQEKINNYECVEQSINFERNKISQNIKELEVSIQELESEIKNEELELKNLDNLYEQQLENYKSSIEPRALINQEQLTNYIEIKVELKRQEEREELLALYKTDLASVNPESNTDLPNVSTMKEILLNEKDLVNEVETEMKKLITDWGIDISQSKDKENQTAQTLKVEFDFDSCDLKIDGRPRETFGQGMRAIIYSAFMIGFMNYCLKKDTIEHPGFVIIDSPLTTYKKNKKKKSQEIANEDFGTETHQLFYSSLSKYTDAQIIIIENDDKRPSNISNINVIDLAETNGLFPEN